VPRGRRASSEAGKSFFGIFRRGHHQDEATGSFDEYGNRIISKTQAEARSPFSEMVGLILAISGVYRAQTCAAPVASTSCLLAPL
jgi:hypothetical protein